MDAPIEQVVDEESKSEEKVERVENMLR